MDDNVENTDEPELTAPDGDDAAKSEAPETKGEQPDNKPDAGPDVTDDDDPHGDTESGNAADDRQPLFAPGSLRFILIFVVCVVAVFLIYDRVKEGPRMASYMSLLSRQVGFFLSFAGKPLELTPAKAIIEYDGFRMQIIPDCGAIPSMCIFTAAVLAFPALIRYKVFGILLGLPLLYLVNVTRLTCLGIIGARCSLSVFRFFHIYVWQTIFIIFVVTVWFLWINLVTAEEKNLPYLARHLWRESRLAFALRFVCCCVLFLGLFVISLRAYSLVIANISGFCLEVFGGYDIRNVSVGVMPPDYLVAEGPKLIKDVLEMAMKIQYGTEIKSMAAADLAYTWPPFLALVFATMGLTWRRRLRAVVVGLAVIMGWHIIMFCTFFVAAVSFGFTEHAPMVRAIGFVNPVLPFLLWFVLLEIRQLPGWGFSSREKSNNERMEVCV